MPSVSSGSSSAAALPLDLVLVGLVVLSSLLSIASPFLLLLASKLQTSLLLMFPLRPSPPYSPWELIVVGLVIVALVWRAAVVLEPVSPWSFVPSLLQVAST